MKKQKIWSILLFTSTLLAILTHAYLSLQKYRLTAGEVDGKSLCNINSQFNCDAVALSDYSQFLGIPIAVWGLATNLILLVLALSIVLNLTSYVARTSRLQFWLAFFIAGSSLVMGGISILKLDKYCLFCITAYILSGLQLVSTLQLAEGSPWRQLPEDLRSLFVEQRWALVAFALIPGLALFFNASAKTQFGIKQASFIVEESLYYWQKAAPQEFNLDEGLVLAPSDSAPTVTIVEFADFLCPHCRLASAPMHTFTESRKGVKLIFKPFPLDGTCNAGMQHKGDGLRCKLAGAALCSESLNKKGWLVHDWIFDHQATLQIKNWTEDLKTMADLAQVPQEKLAECIDSGATQDLLLKLAAEGARAQIKGTPTMFVNGRQLERAQFLPVLDAVYKNINPTN